MDIHTATEEAYKRGYEAGKRDAVVRGQVEEVEIVPNYMWKYRCSCCHSNAERWYKYCQNCGAKMDSE